MRVFAAFILLCCSLKAAAWGEPDYRIRIDAGLMAGINTGQFNYRTSNSLVLGQVENGAGFAGRISIPVYHNWVLGTSVTFSQMSYRQDNIKAQLAKQYSGPENFTTVTAYPTGYGLTQVSLEFAYSFHNNYWNIEPFVRLGITKLGNPGSFSVYDKRRNENYYEQYDISFDNGDNSLYFNTGFGLHGERRLAKRLFLTLTAALQHTSLNVDMTVDRNNLYNQRSNTTTTVSQSATMVQFSWGLQLRLGKKQ